MNFECVAVHWIGQKNFLEPTDPAPDDYRLERVRQHECWVIRKIQTLMRMIEENNLGDIAHMRFIPPGKSALHRFELEVILKTPLGKGRAVSILVNDTLRTIDNCIE